jgi:tropomyosin
LNDCLALVLITDLSVTRLRSTDVKAEHFERQVTRLQEERDTIEKKLDESNMKLKESQRELDNLVSEMDALVSCATSG